jgi:hypothetical protein
MARIRILGDYVIGDHLKDVKVEELLGMRFDFKYVSTMSSLILELDPNGPEKITLISCMNSLFEEFIHEETLPRGFDQLRLIFDAYMANNHDIYYCPPVGKSTDKITKSYLDVLNRLSVSRHSYDVSSYLSSI